MDDLPQPDEAIRAALAGIAIEFDESELDESELDERRPRWPKFVLAGGGALAVVALVAGVVWRKQTAEREVVPAAAPRRAAANRDTARVTITQVGEVEAPAVRSVAPASPKTKPAKPPTGRAVVATISVGPTKPRIAIAQNLTLSAVVMGEDGRDIEGRAVSWTSSRRRVATVSSKGVVTGRRAGTAKITATAGGKRSSVLVTVTARARVGSQQH